jgi:RHS repeat-associated protein
VGFTGHSVADEMDLGLIDMGGREYDPRLGRFLSEDPFVAAPLFSESLNRYSYTLNNPLAYTDPSGYWAFGISDGWRICIGPCDSGQIEQQIDSAAAAVEETAEVAGKALVDGGNGLLTGIYPGASVLNALGFDEWTPPPAQYFPMLYHAMELTGGSLGLLFDLYGMGGSMTMAGGGVVACGTGVGCIAGAPVIAAGEVGVAVFGTMIVGHASNVADAASSLSTLMMEGGAKYPNDHFTSSTSNKSAYFKSEGEARALAREKIGKNPVKVGKNKFRSADGKWQYRAKPGDVAGDSRGPHVHLEELNPKTGEVITNWHLRWPQGAGR